MFILLCYGQLYYFCYNCQFIMLSVSDQLSTTTSYRPVHANVESSLVSGDLQEYTVLTSCACMSK